MSTVSVTPVPLEQPSTAAFHKISWGAVLAGAVIALTAHFLLNLLGIGIGAAVLDPMTNDNPDASTFSIGSAIWFILTGIIASFAGGYIASRLSGRPSTSTGALHGLTSWAVTTLFLLYLLGTSVGALVGGVYSGLSGLVAGAGQTAATVATAAAPSIATATDPMASIEQQVRETSGSDPESLRNAAVAAVRGVMTGDPAQADNARTQAAEALARAQNIPVEQARSQVQLYEAQYRQAVESAKQTAVQAADTATSVISIAAIIAFISLAVGAAAAWIGGAVGTKHGIELDDIA
ncbi:PhnA-like protein [Metarhizobium album]|uniref:PhnA-like protein n=1 Tax=Metarhizobium album TaxID=2182425 RepID=A0A2U2DL16_9HYPH|nr:PhnA-like protein [Rhizobium album]PWE53983.1 PhnA-like protein [Rhizobium album]